MSDWNQLIKQSSIYVNCNGDSQFNCARLIGTQVIVFGLFIYLLHLLYQLRKYYRGVNKDVVIVIIQVFQCIVQIVICTWKPAILLTILALFIELMTFSYINFLIALIYYNINNPATLSFKVDKLIFRYKLIIAIYFILLVLDLFFSHCKVYQDIPRMVMYILFFFQFILYLLRGFKIVIKIRQIQKEDLNSSQEELIKTSNYNFYQQYKRRLVFLFSYYLINILIHYFCNIMLECMLDGDHICNSSGKIYNDQTLEFQIFLLIKQLQYLMPVFVLGKLFRLQLPKRPISTSKLIMIGSNFDPKIMDQFRGSLEEDQVDSYVYDKNFECIDNIQSNTKNTTKYTVL